MTSFKVWGWVLLGTGIIVDLGLSIILAIALMSEPRDVVGVQFILAFMVPGAAMCALGLYFLVRARSEASKPK
ncbi:MAG TPA: hypothetical protein PKA27_03990 [Fimbriimonadaceae bacterium]|nr:hypothetical protein [Fimbriimonadaceae bacterium]